MNLFRKRKPIRTIGLIDLSGRAVYCDDTHYIPVQVSFFEKEVTFELHRYEDDKTREQKRITLPKSDERLWHVLDGVLFWDSANEVFRIRTTPKGESAPIWENGRIYENQVLEIDASWAEQHLTPEALGYAQKVENVYHWYCSDGSASPVVFEWPKLFTAFEIPPEACGPNAEWAMVKIHPLAPDFISVTNQLTTYATAYLDAFFEDTDDLYPRYKINTEKTI